MSNKHILVSYPRSGSNYFQLAWRQKTKKHIDCIRSSKVLASVHQSDSLSVIGLTRDPIEAIPSRFLITQTHEKFIGTSKDALEFSISEYIKIYKFIIEVSEYIIDLSDFTNIDKIIEHISGLESNPIAVDQINDRISKIHNYSPSFTEHEDYENAKNILKTYDLSECYALYDLAYSKRLVV